MMMINIYTKIGNKVSFSLRITGTISAKGSGNVMIKNLPFASKTGSLYFPLVSSVGYFLASAKAAADFSKFSIFIPLLLAI